MCNWNSRPQSVPDIFGACSRGAKQGRRHEQADRQPVPRPGQTGRSSAGLVGALSQRCI